MSFDTLFANLKKGKIAPLYLLHGTEPYYIDKAVQFFEKELLPEAERSFNLTVFYGKDSQAQDITDTARRYPMMAERQVVIVKEANQLRDIEGLESYAANPVPSTVLVIAYKQKKYDARKKLYKAIGKQGEIYESKTPYDNHLPGFLAAALKEKGMTATPKAITIMLDHIGADLGRLVNEIDKLAINVPKGTDITAEHIEQFIGISKDFNVFELQNALLEKDTGKAIRICHYMMANPKENPLVLVFFNIHSCFQKLYLMQHAGRVGEKEYWSAYRIPPPAISSYKYAMKAFSPDEIELIFGDLLEFDLRMKGVGNTGNTEDKALLEELILRICAARRLMA